MDADQQLDLTTEHNLDSVMLDPSGFVYVQYQNVDNVVQPIEEGPGPLPILAWVEDLERQPMKGLQQPFVGAGSENIKSAEGC